jgi:hypothetical protein
LVRGYKMNCFITVPCPRKLNMDENVKKNLFEMFTMIISDKKIKITNIEPLTSSEKPCVWEVKFQHTITLEDRHIEEGIFIGLEQFISMKLAQQKPMNVKNYQLEFYNENAGRITFHIKCDCLAPDFCYGDQIDP